jgi:hypothetical protein
LVSVWRWATGDQELERATEYTGGALGVDWLIIPELIISLIKNRISTKIWSLLIISVSYVP